MFSIICPFTIFWEKLVMQKEKIIQILKKSAINYKNNLENKNFMIVYEKEKKIEYIQIKFLDGNFLHLTGIQLNEKISSKLFYKKCLNGKLSKREINLRIDGTTQLKLQILEKITNICQIAKILGTYNHTRKNLHTEFIIGTDCISLGFIQISNNFFIPNTALNENIKKIVHKPYHIVAIFSKKINEKFYNEICLYKKEKINNTKILEMLSNEIEKKINV